MRRNGGIIGPEQTPSETTPGDVKIFDNHDRHIRGTGSWPNIKEITSLTKTAPATGSSVTLHQNDITTFTVAGTGYEGGAETLYYTINKNSSNYPDSWNIFTAENGSFTMSTSGSGTFNVQTNFACDPNYASGTFQKMFTIEIRSGSVSGPILLTSTTLYVLNWTIPTTWTGFQTTTVDELGTNSGVLRFKIEDVGTAGSANGALRFIYPIFLDYTSSNGIHLNGGSGWALKNCTAHYDRKDLTYTAGPGQNPDNTEQDWEDFDFGFSAVDADELGEIVSPSKTAEAVGKVEVQSNHVLERLDTIQTMLTLEVDARKKELEEKYQNENSEVFKNLEKMIIPLLKNLQKNPDKEYIYWPNRTEKLQKQIDKILEITRSTEDK